MPELVIVDATTGTVRVLASASSTRIVTPSWRPDGRTIVAAVAQGDETFTWSSSPLTARRRGG